MSYRIEVKNVKGHAWFFVCTGDIWVFSFPKGATTLDRSCMRFAHECFIKGPEPMFVNGTVPLQQALERHGVWDIYLKLLEILK